MIPACPACLEFVLQAGIPFSPPDLIAPIVNMNTIQQTHIDQPFS